MSEEEYIHLITYYDIGPVRKIVLLLDKEKIDFKAVNKSNQTNYRVPMSTYTEIDVMVNKDDFEKAEQILKDFNELNPNEQCC
jgi:hypothetical protein